MTVSQQSKAEPPMHKLHRDEYAMSAEQVAQILGISRQRVDQIEQEAMVAQLVEQHLVKLGVINHRRYASCESFAPLGNYCLKFDDRVPDDFLPVGCDDWTQVMPI